MARALVVLTLLGGCAAADEVAGEGAAADLVSEPVGTDAVGGAVRPFASNEYVERYNSRARVSFDDAPAVESPVLASQSRSNREAALRLRAGGFGNNVSISFGRPGEGKPTVGVYRCSDGNASVQQADTSTSPLTWKRAGTCSIAVDYVEESPSGFVIRVRGRFSSLADGQMSLKVDGAFVLDFTTR